MVPIIYSDFGLGPFGKGRTILEHSPPGIQAQLLSASDEAVNAAINSANLVIVVGDPELANKAKLLNKLVVFIDSLPFLWTEADPLPVSADVYCAQVTDFLPKECWNSLKQIENLVWIAPVIPEHNLQARQIKRGTALIHFGGLQSPVAGSQNYLDVILPPIIKALAAHRVNSASICCGPNAVKAVKLKVDAILSTTNYGDLSISIGFETRGTLFELVRNAEYVFTSPGLTFMLETSQLNVPVILLPPQNLSQIFNLERYVRQVEGSVSVDWPHVYSGEIERIRLSEVSEKSKVAELYELIEAMGADQESTSRLYSEFIRVLASSSELPNAISFSDFGFDGVSGADEIWSHAIKLANSRRESAIDNKS